MRKFLHASLFLSIPSLAHSIILWQRPPALRSFHRRGAGFFHSAIRRSATASSSDSDVHKTLAEGSHVSELIVKKSRFLAYARSVPSWAAAQEYLNEIKQEHPKARHWCWGYAGVASEERCSDDGEPTGTAGLPILGAIQGENLEQVMCVVVRYFGGIKLGAGSFTC